MLYSDRSKTQKRADQKERRKRSPTPKPTKVHIGRLTKNVTKVSKDTHFVGQFAYILYCNVVLMLDACMGVLCSWHNGYKFILLKTIVFLAQEHILEIFSTYGKIKMVEMPMDRGHPHLSRGSAYVEFETSDEAQKALRHMEGGNQLFILVCFFYSSQVKV